MGDARDGIYGFTWTDRVPLALSVESVPVIVVVPCPAIVPVLPLVILMTLELLEVNDVFDVTSVPFRVAVNVTVEVPAPAMLIGLAGVEVMVRVPVADWPMVKVMVPETTLPSDDCAEA